MNTNGYEGKGGGSRGLLGYRRATGLAGAVAFAFATFAFAAMTPRAASAQTATSETASDKNEKSEQWIHVRVENKDNGGETVRVNVPVEMAAKVLPAIHNKNLKDGRVHIQNAHMDDVDFKALLEAVRTAKDGEYVTVQSNENNVRVAKNAGYLYVHVTEREHGKKGEKGEEAGTKVEVKVPMKVVDALFSGEKDELDVVAALRALSSHGDMELVTVKDNENLVRVWIDSKNVSN